MSKAGAVVLLQAGAAAVQTAGDTLLSVFGSLQAYYSTVNQNCNCTGSHLYMPAHVLWL